MRAGKLSRVIVIERATHTINDAGTPGFDWTPIATLRAELLRYEAEELIRGGAVDEEAVIFRTRHLAGITTADRVNFAGRHFNIRALIDLGPLSGLELHCAKQEN